MPGPCSLPNGDKDYWEQLNEMNCRVHRYCWKEYPSKYVTTEHDFVSLRLWLMERGRLRTGKTVC